MLLGLDVCVPVGVEVEVDDEAPDVEDAEDVDADEEADDDAAGEVVVRRPRVDDGELVGIVDDDAILRVVVAEQAPPGTGPGAGGHR